MNMRRQNPGMGRGGGRGGNVMGGRGRGMMGGPPGRGGGRGGGPPPGMSHYGPSASTHPHQGGRGMMMGRGDNHFNHPGRMDGRGPNMMGRGPPLPHVGRGNMMGRGPGPDMRRGPRARDPRGRGPMNNDFGRYGPAGSGNRFPMDNRGPPPPPPPPPPPNRTNHQMQPGRGHPQQNVMRMHPNQPHMNQQQQPFVPGGHLHQPFNGQQQQQMPMMAQSPLQMQHQMQMAGMPPPPMQQQQQQQVFPPNGQPQPVGQFPPHQQMQMVNQQGPPPQIISPQHTQQIVAAASPAAPASAPTADGWTEHRSPHGIPYYFNTITNVSTYEKPASLSQPLQNGAAAAAPLAASTIVSTPANASGTSATASSSWQTYTDQNTGKKYYSNGVTVTWTRPQELGPDESADDNSTQASNNKRSSVPDNETAKKKRKKGEKDDVCLYANKAEALAAFKGLLLAKDIAPTTKWNDVVRICSEDSRWDACNTIGERKQALAEYQTKRANELRNVKRQEKVRAKEAYQRLLTDILPTVKTFSPGSSRFMDVRDFLSKDDRFYAVDDETTREELFYEFVEEMRKRDERIKRSKKREAKDAYLAFLKLREEEGKLTFASTWTSFVSSLDEGEKNDSRFILSSNMSESDRQLYFSDYVIELQNAEDEKRRRIRDARRRAEKAQRDAFREKLREFAKLGTITPSTHWRSVGDKIAADPCYEPVLAQGRDVPMEIFNDFVDDWNEQYRRDRSTLSRLWESSKKKIKLDESTEVEFSKKLLDYSASSPDIYADIRRMSSNGPLSSIMLFFNELKTNSGVNSANGRSGLLNDEDSSEDEGEIKEDREEAE